MAWHDRLQPAGELHGPAPGPCANNRRGTSDGPKAADKGDLVLNVLRNVDLSPPLVATRRARTRPAGRLSLIHI
eukprot:13335643-Alexandrium_andersonii.AAC.1